MLNVIIYYHLCKYYTAPDVIMIFIKTCEHTLNEKKDTNLILKCNDDSSVDGFWEGVGD